jgi:hypothetical protein
VGEVSQVGILNGDAAPAHGAILARQVGGVMA